MPSDSKTTIKKTIVQRVPDEATEIRLEHGGRNELFTWKVGAFRFVKIRLDIGAAWGADQPTGPWTQLARA